jgi:hypothetical protein
VRLFIEIILAAAIVALAWEKPLQERTRDIPWLGDQIAPVVKAPDHPRSSTLNPRPTPTPAAWMWDANGRSALNTPPPKSENAPSTPSSSPGSWMFDPNHRSPLDPPSKKHPQPTPH